MAGEADVFLGKTQTFADWIDGLCDIRARACVLARVERLAMGHAGDAKPVRDGVTELRIDYGPGYRVYFKGRYGALPVISVGPLARPGGILAGTDFAQPPSFVVIDLAQGVPERVFAVEGPAFDRRFDESLLPETVEVYTR